MNNKFDAETSVLNRDTITKLALDDIIVHSAYYIYERGDITYEQMLIGIVAALVHQKQYIMKNMEDIITKNPYPKMWICTRNG